MLRNPDSQSARKVTSRRSDLRHVQLTAWANAFQSVDRPFNHDVTCSALAGHFRSELANYFALAALSRSRSAVAELAKAAHEQVFRVRVQLERAVFRAVSLAPFSDLEKIRSALSGGEFFGASKKQGTSLRMPLSTCIPTSLCKGACYAHDVLDATPLAVVRGAINGWIANQYEQGSGRLRRAIMLALDKHCVRAVRNARSELAFLPKDYKRRPFIRFSHVGEITNYPRFADALARLIKQRSDGEVDCVVYTRHKNVQQLDPKLWIINFTLDPASMDRQSWVPLHARTVFSAFGGVTSDMAEVNFLEHHRHIHMAQSSGSGRICPATKPETKVRTCDACRCNRCFVQPNRGLIASDTPAHV